MSSIPQDFFCEEGYNQNFSQLVASAECQEMGKCVCADVCEEELIIQSRQNHSFSCLPQGEMHSFELVIPVTYGFHEIQEVRA